MALRFTNFTRDALAAELETLTEGGSLHLYAGALPDAADDSAGSATLLVSFALPAGTFGVSTSSDSEHGRLSLTTSLSATATASGTAAWGEVVDADGNKLFDFTANPTVTAGKLLTIASLVITVPERC